jgi:hypothetical protein
MRLDDEDKEAARTLLGRKKRKRKRRPLSEQLWFRAIKYTVPLVLVAGAIYFLLIKKPSADALYKQAEELMASNDPGKEDWRKAREGPIQQFLHYYRTDSRAGKVQEWADQFDVWDRERLVLLWIAKSLDVTSEPEGIAREAIRNENEGKFTEARKEWEKNLSWKDSTTESRPWGLLADKRMKELDRVEAREQELRKAVEQAVKEGKTYTPEGDAERLAAAAMTEEVKENFKAARQFWLDMREKYTRDRNKQNYSQRVWYLLAAKRVREVDALLAKGSSTDPKSK